MLAMIIITHNNKNNLVSHCANALMPQRNFWDVFSVARCDTYAFDATAFKRKQDETPTREYVFFALNWSCHGCLMMDIMRCDAPLCANTISFISRKTIARRTYSVTALQRTLIYYYLVFGACIFATIHLLKVFVFFSFGFVLFCLLSHCGRQCCHNFFL